MLRIKCSTWRHVVCHLDESKSGRQEGGVEETLAVLGCVHSPAAKR